MSTVHVGKGAANLAVLGSTLSVGIGGIRTSVVTMSYGTGGYHEGKGVFEGFVGCTWGEEIGQKAAGEGGGSISEQVSLAIEGPVFTSHAKPYTQSLGIS